MKIYILEDDFLHLARLENALDALIKKHRLADVKVESFDKSQQLLDSITETGNHLLFLLDIDLKNDKRTGLDVAKEIRKTDPYASIVFITTHSEFMPLTFEYQVMAREYIAKELDDNDFIHRIENVLLESYRKIGVETPDLFQLHTSNFDIQIPFHELLYIETATRSHYVIVCTETESFDIPLSLDEIQKLDSRLFRCHRSFLVNPRNIYKIERERRLVHFKNGESCPISRYKMRGLVEVFEKL